MLIQDLQMFPIPQTSFLVGTFFAASYSKTALEKLSTWDSFKKDFNPLCCTLSYSTISVSRVFKAPLMVILTLARAARG